MSGAVRRYSSEEMVAPWDEEKKTDLHSMLIPSHPSTRLTWETRGPSDPRSGQWPTSLSNSQFSEGAGFVWWHPASPAYIPLHLYLWCLKYLAHGGFNACRTHWRWQSVAWNSLCLLLFFEIIWYRCDIWYPAGCLEYLSNCWSENGIAKNVSQCASLSLGLAIYVRSFLFLRYGPLQTWKTQHVLPGVSV